jgi:hypothetical protein
MVVQGGGDAGIIIETGRMDGGGVGFCEVKQGGLNIFMSHECKRWLNSSTV